MAKAEILHNLTGAFSREFKDGLKHREPTWSKIAMRVKSSAAFNNYAWLNSFPKMREWVGERQRKNLAAEAMVIANKTFETTVEVERTDIEDDQVGLYLPIMKQAGVSAAELPDDLVWPLLSRGKEVACYDGQPFFDTEHPCYAEADGTGAMTPQSNLTVASDGGTYPAWYVIDSTNVIMPLVWQERLAPEFEAKFDPSRSDITFIEDKYLYGVRARGNAGFGMWQLAHRAEVPLTADNLAAVIKTMKETKADGGATLKIRPSLLVVPPALEDAAKKLLKQTIQNGSTNIYAGALELHVESSLS